MILDVTELRVYQHSLSLLLEVYELVSKIPITHDKLRKQVTASTESIPPLIAEGFGKRRSDKEFKRFIEMAMGSSDETIAHLQIIMILSQRFRSIPRDLCQRLQFEYKSISKQLNRLRNNWNSF